MAAQKLVSLENAGADITVVAPDICRPIARSAAHLRRRAFRPADLAGQWLVVSAATPEVNRAVAREARRRRVFVNAVDDPGNASAYLGGVLRRQGVTVAISTAGRAPALAGLLREAIDELLPSDLRRWFAESDRLRIQWRAGGVPMEERRPQLLEALARLHPPATRDRAGVRSRA